MGKDRILVVDDDADNRAMVGHFLTSWGYEVREAENGRVALDKIRSDPPSLVLLDLEMPEMDGFETCEALKGDPETEWIPVVIFTGLEMIPQRVRGFRHGADDYVVKSVDPDELRTRLELVLKRAQRYAALAAAPSMPVLEAEAIEEADQEPAPPAAAAPSEDFAVSVMLSRIPFPDAMRLVLAHGKNGVVQLADNGSTGSIHLHDGRVVHAELGDDRGEEAFYELALWKNGRFDFRDCEPGEERTIEASTRSLLTEAGRRHDAWSVISSKVKSFDLVPSWVPLVDAKSIRLTQSDWSVIRLVNGRRSIRDIVAELNTDLFEAGRVIHGLMTVGVLRLDRATDERDEALELIPLRGPSIDGAEPFELTASEWRLLSHVDGMRSLGMVRELANFSGQELVKTVKSLKERGFLTLRAGEGATRKHA